MKLLLTCLGVFPVIAFAQIQLPLTLRTGPALTRQVLSTLVSSLSKHERASLMLELWDQQDVVDVMKITGNGEGLDERRVVQVFGEDSVRVVTEGDKFRMKKDGFQFMDITDHPDLGKQNARRLAITNLDSREPEWTSYTKAKDSVAELLKDFDDKNLRADIAKLSSFWNRSYRSPWGLASSNWIFEQVETIFNSTSNSAVKTSVRKFPHKFVQNSVVATIESAESGAGDEEQEYVILGAHQDSLNYRLPFYRAPGADDDGSGSVTILQALRSVVEQKFVAPPGIVIEFHWYAAEEGGLLGSQDIAAAYEEEGVNVRGMLQMDMTAFVRNGTTPIIGFFGDQVDRNLTTFATKLVDNYIPLKWNMTGCGKSCGSDHMSWTRAGYRAAFATESLFEDGSLEFIHTAKDDIYQDGQYSFEHMLEFVKLGIAFVVELAAIRS